MKKTKTAACTLAAMVLLAGCASKGGQTDGSAAVTQADASATNEVVVEVQEVTGLVSDLTDEQQRALVFGSVLAVRNDMDFISVYGCDETIKASLGDSYKTEDRSEYLETFKEGYMDVLESGWDITDTDSALETLDWLKDEGHRISLDEEVYGFDEIFELIKKGETEGLEDEAGACEDVFTALKENYDYTEEELNAVNTVSAWDFDRLVVVARWCYTADYITEEEMWKYINAAAEQGAKDYDSWRTYFAGAALGRAIWSGGDGFDSRMEAIADQLLQDNASIYNTISFK